MLFYFKGILKKCILPFLLHKTLFCRYDFFIVSQSVRQGTVSPTSYNVIFDNTGLDPDKMQKFTYKMTHLYYNWSVRTLIHAVTHGKI